MAALTLGLADEVTGCGCRPGRLPTGLRPCAAFDHALTVFEGLDTARIVECFQLYIGIGNGLLLKQDGEYLKPCRKGITLCETIITEAEMTTTVTTKG